jgi:hypothetical protein
MYLKVMHVIDVWLYDNNDIIPGAEEFQKKYAAFRAKPLTRFVFSDESLLAEAQSFLREHNLKSQHFYQFQLQTDEIAAYPAIYFGINIADNIIPNRIVNPTLIGNLDIVKDYYTEQILFSPYAKIIIKNTTKGLELEDVDSVNGNKWARIKTIETLPEPIIIPKPLEFGVNDFPVGTYWVQSDGRDVITDTNVSKLKEVGLGVSHQVMIKSEVKNWRPRYIASGKVMHALQLAGILGLLQPFTPLITETDPLVRNE